jgi:hypothetical protein
MTAGTPAHTTASASPTSTSGSLLSLIGTYQRLQNEQTGGCLADSGGSAPSAQPCATSRSEGWEYSVPLTGLLSAPTSGQFELVDQDSGKCLTAGSGSALSMQTCDGGAAQLWTKAGTSASGGELRSADDAQCLRATGSVVTQGPCATGDAADLWSEDGSA